MDLNVFHGHPFVANGFDAKLPLFHLAIETEPAKVIFCQFRSYVKRVILICLAIDKNVSYVNDYEFNNTDVFW